jgi:hypothetical protein
VAEPYTGTGWAKEIVHEATGIEMVFIPAGEFLMGSPPTQAGRDNRDEAQHHVRITRPFYMGKYEVTQGEWQKVIGNNPSTFKGSDRLPVEQVSWNGCQAFCQRAGSGLRLPTEAEWEYACRAGTQTRYLSGDADSTLDDCAWYTVNSGNRTHPVGQKRPNAWGLYDMQGNVLEWCADYWYRESPGVGTARVRRGSCWGGGPRDCRSGSSDRASPDHTDYNNGFRVALDLLGKTEMTLPATEPDKAGEQAVRVVPEPPAAATKRPTPRGGQASALQNDAQKIADLVNRMKSGDPLRPLVALAWGSAARSNRTASRILRTQDSGGVLAGYGRSRKDTCH